MMHQFAFPARLVDKDFLGREFFDIVGHERRTLGLLPIGGRYHDLRYRLRIQPVDATHA